MIKTILPSKRYSEFAKYLNHVSVERHICRRLDPCSEEVLKCAQMGRVI